MLLRPALVVADRIAAALPARVAYALADFAGDTWRRLAPGRRSLVTANLARVCVVTGRPTEGPAFRRLVRDAFRNHARYYLELLRAPHYRRDEIETIVDVPGWETMAAAIVGRPAILVSWHLGNFEPFGTFLAHHGLRPLAPIEEIEPRALYEFLGARRGGGVIDLVPVREARAPLTRRLREHGLIAIIGDRDLPGTGLPVTVFGHPTTMPAGPAVLALAHGAAVVAGRSLRLGPDRYRAEGVAIPLPASGDRRADTATLVAALAAQLERDIAEAPEQWWGAFQAYWPDLDGDRA